MTDPPPSAEYERLVETLVESLALQAGVQCERVVRDIRLQGRGTINQIDVLWDFTDTQGQPQRVVFEARSYKNRVDQGKLHAFRSVVDDIQDATRPVTGVMVTTAGYQRGAKDVASTYGLLVWELRTPTEADFAGRLGKIELNIRMYTPIIEDVIFEAAEVAEGHLPAISETINAFEIAPTEEDPNRKTLDQVLCRGELGTWDTPRPVHSVRREFHPPAVLFVRGQKAAMLHAITAQVGDAKAPPITTTVGGAERIAWMLRDSLKGSRVWIARDGQTWPTMS